MTLVLLIIVALGLILGLWLVGTVLSLMYQLFIGLVIGGLARFLLPGPRPMSWLVTSLCGIVGSLIGGMLAHHVFHTHSLGALVLNIVCAMGVVALLGRE
jgi:uncharacterized membrane protein YeaQ/YmgE (transglycosylase-associated protein family)